MGSILYKWFLAGFLVFVFSGASYHPIYVSVVEAEHNPREKSLEVSCKLFIDDFERTLRMDYKTHVDLLNPSNRAAMDKLVSDYVQKHLQFSVNGKRLQMRYLGYERIDEGIYSYFEAVNVPVPETVDIYNDLLYAYHEQQLGLMHVTVNGTRKSTKLNNPEKTTSLRF